MSADMDASSLGKEKSNYTPVKIPSLFGNNFFIFFELIFCKNCFLDGVVF